MLGVSHHMTRNSRQPNHHPLAPGNVIIPNTYVTAHFARSGDASIKTFNIDDKVFVANLEGHDDSVQACLL